MINHLLKAANIKFVRTRNNSKWRTARGTTRGTALIAYRCRVGHSFLHVAMPPRRARHICTEDAVVSLIS